MNKKNMWDNSNLQQEIIWDNQKVSGITDEELFAKKWDRTGPSHPMYGKKQTEEHKKKRSEVQKGKKQSQDHVEKAAATRRGVPKSTEHNKKNSESQKGKKQTYETINKRIAATKKPIHTPYGEFDSRKHAMQWMSNNGIKGGEGKIRKGLKEDPENFYYIKK